LWKLRIFERFWQKMTEFLLLSLRTVEKGGVGTQNIDGKSAKIAERPQILPKISQIFSV